MNLEEASKLADEIVEELKSACERIEVAGSIRRKKPDGIKDVEIVAVPRYRYKEKVVNGDLFSPTKVEGYQENLLDLRMRYNMLEACAKQTIMPNCPWDYGDKRGPKQNISAPFSERYYSVKYKGAKVDLFVVMPPAEFGPIFTIRTGSKDFTHWLVSQGWKDGYYFEEGRILRYLWKGTRKPITGDQGPITVDKYVTEPVPAPEESDVFRILKLPEYPVEKREMVDSRRVWLEK